MVVYTGSLLDGKGVARLTEAMDRLLSDRRGRCFFVVVGYPADRLRAHVREMGHADRCRLPGEVDYGALPQWLSAADVAVEPKEAGAGEASGKMLHYLAAGLPVVCFDSPFHRSVLGKAGYFADPGDPEGLSGAIQRALADPASAREKGARGKAVALRRYSVAAAGSSLDAVYRRLLTIRGNNPRQDEPESITQCAVSADLTGTTRSWCSGWPTSWSTADRTRRGSSAAKRFPSATGG